MLYICPAQKALHRCGLSLGPWQFPTPGPLFTWAHLQEKLVFTNDSLWHAVPIGRADQLAKSILPSETPLSTQGAYAFLCGCSV